MSCHHELVPVAIPDYQRCIICGTYLSMKKVPPEDIYKPGYRAEIGHSSVWEQAWNVDMLTVGGVSKNRFVIDRIESNRGSVLEIGCSPGRLLYWLTHAARFGKVVGIDPDDPELIHRIGCFDGELLTGFFPKVTCDIPGESFDLVIGLDVFEHSDDPIAFLAECHRLLKLNGQLFLMMPMAEELPVDSRFFDPVEHLYIHSRRNLDTMLNDAGLSSGWHDRWAVGHETVSARKVKGAK